MPRPAWFVVAMGLLSLEATAQTSTPTPTAAATPTPVAEEVAAGGASIEERVTVSSRAAESITASTTVLDRAWIERSQSTTAAEIVREVAGVHLLESGSLAGTSHVLTRGGDANFTLVLLDGIPLNDATDVQGGAFDLSTLDVDAIEEVEILRGPFSHFFGSSAVAGAINLVTRGGGDEAEMRLRLDAGEDSLLHAGASISGPVGTSRADATRAPDELAEDEVGVGFFAGAQFDRERQVIADDAYRQLALHGAITVPLGESSAMRLTGRAADLESDDYPPGSGGPVFGSGELRHTDGQQQSLGLTWGLEAGGWFHRGSAGGSRTREEVGSPAIELAVPPSVEDRDYTRSQLSWIAERRPVSRGVHVSLGAQLDHERGQTESILLLPDFLGGEVTGDYRLSRTTPGVFAALTVDASPVVIEAGLRADDPETLEVEWSPRVGVWSSLGSTGLSARASWSRAFKLPSFFALASPPALGGNPALLPETSVGFDAGVEYERGANLLGATVFHSAYEDLIDFDFERFLHVNRSRIEAEGVELVARWRPIEELVVAAAWTFQDVEDASAANVALHSPEQFGKVSLEWSPIESLRLRAEGRAVGHTADVQIPAPGAARIEGYQVVDLQASWHAGKRWLLRAGVDNATGQEYQHFLGFPQPGRRGRVGVEYDFR